MLLCCGLLAAQPPFIGTWSGNVNGNIIKLRFDAANNVQFGQYQGSWQLTDNNGLYLNIGGQEIWYSWSVQGTTLALQNLTMQETLVFQRTDANVAAAPTDWSGAPFWFIRINENTQLEWCALDPHGPGVTVREDFGDIIITDPALRANGQSVVFAVKHPVQPRLLGAVDGKPFEIKFPANMDMEVRHPSFSRDGRLLAFTLKSSKHVGNVNVYDWDSGAFDGTFTAVGQWYKVLSIDLQSGQQQAVYHDDAMVPDVMKKRGLGPVFSPVEDRLVYADNYRIYLCDGHSGENLATWETPSISSGGWTGRALVSEYSGLAFSPDGTTIAYLSQGEADIAISPCWLVLLDVKNGSSSFITLPDGISGGTPFGNICLDFSPDGEYVLFSVTGSDPNHPVLCGVHLDSGQCTFWEDAGRGFGVVWKGR